MNKGEQLTDYFSLARARRWNPSGENKMIDSASLFQCFPVLFAPRYSFHTIITVHFQNVHIVYIFSSV